MLIFLAAFAATVVLASMAENIAKFTMRPLRASGYKQQLANIPFKNGGRIGFRPIPARNALAKSP
jgi:hypothetical protein